MIDNEQKRIFTDNLNRLLREKNVTQIKAAEAIGVSQQTFNNWCTYVAIPRMDKIQKLADYFGVQKTDLIDEYEPKQTTAEMELMTLFNSMNDEGKEIALNMIRTLASTPLYKKCYSVMEA